MTDQEFEEIQIGDKLRIGALEVELLEKKFQYGVRFCGTAYGDFNASLCSRISAIIYATDEATQ